MADRPHFALPFRFVARGDGTLDAAMTEQDTSDEIADCIEVAIRTVQGERRSLPEFGRPESLEFAINATMAREQLRQSLQTTEPRAIAVVEREPDEHDEGQLRLRVMFGLAESEP